MEHMDVEDEPARAAAVSQGSIPALARVSETASHVEWHLE